MSCDHSLLEQHLFDYLEQRTTPQTTSAITQAIERCEHCHELYLSALNVRNMTHHWQEQSVPHWHRTRYAVARSSKTTWNWLNALSLTTSVLALLMVLFRVEFTTSEHGFTVSFGGKTTQAQWAQMVEQKFDQLALQQIDYIENRFKEQRLQQASDNQQLLAKLLQHNRQERRQDLNLLMASWLQQRDLDQQKFNQRVAYLLENQIENNRYLNQILTVSNQPNNRP
jgi:hypothetical protein